MGMGKRKLETRLGELERRAAPEPRLFIRYGDGPLRLNGQPTDEQPAASDIVFRVIYADDSIRPEGQEG